MTVSSGVGTATSSGAVLIQTSNSGTTGVSGNMALKTGTSTVGVSGNMALTTGASTIGATGSFTVSTGTAAGGAGGAISMTVGSGDTGSGGAMTLAAGDSSALNAAGGAVSITGGSSTTSDGVGGGVSIDAGVAASGVENGNVTIGVTSASAVTIGAAADDKRILLNGLTEAHTLKVGRQDYSGVLNKHLKFDSAQFTPPDLYPGSVYVFDVYAPGAALGDVVQASFSRSLGNAFLTANVNEADKVRLAVHNPGYNTVTEQLEQGSFVVTCTGYAVSPYVARFAVPPP